MAFKLQSKAVAMQRAIATGNQIVNTLLGHRQATKDGIPAIKNQATGEEIAPAVSAAEYNQAFKDTFGADAVAKFDEAAELFADEESESSGEDESASKKKKPASNVAGASRR